MKYYRLFQNIDIRILGKHPQIIDIVVPTTVTDPHYLSKYLFKKTDKNVQAPKGVLHDKAKWTDILSASSIGFTHGFCISQKLLDVINEFNVRGVEFIATEVWKRTDPEVKYNYFIPHVYEFNFDKLDYNSTIFIEKQSPFDNAGDLKVIKSPDEHRALSASLAPGQLIELLQMVFSDNDDDFFALRSVNSGDVGFFVSQRLIDAINEKQCTGLLFMEINSSYP